MSHFLKLWNEDVIEAEVTNCNLLFMLQMQFPQKKFIAFGRKVVKIWKQILWWERRQESGQEIGQHVILSIWKMCGLAKDKDIDIKTNSTTFFRSFITSRKERNTFTGAYLKQVYGCCSSSEFTYSQNKSIWSWRTMMLITVLSPSSKVLAPPRRVCGSCWYCQC